jgi:hypothetical protein
MRGRLVDVHGAGAQRSDPKIGRRENDPQYFGPQGDVKYVFNYVRCVRTVRQVCRVNSGEVYYETSV